MRHKLHFFFVHIIICLIERKNIRRTLLHYFRNSIYFCVFMKILFYCIPIYHPPKYIYWAQIKIFYSVQYNIISPLGYGTKMPSVRRHHVASRLIRRHFYVMCPLGLLWHWKPILLHKLHSYILLNIFCTCSRHHPSTKIQKNLLSLTVSRILLMNKAVTLLRRTEKVAVSVYSFVWQNESTVVFFSLFFFCFFFDAQWRSSRHSATKYARGRADIFWKR